MSDIGIPYELAEAGLLEHDVRWYPHYGDVELVDAYPTWYGRRLRDDYTTAPFSLCAAIDDALKRRDDARLRWRP
jgi:hypothetical protein